jgi:hypothetical protein
MLKCVMITLMAIPELGTSVGEQRSEESSVDVRLSMVGIGSFSGELRSELTQEVRRMKRCLLN